MGDFKAGATSFPMRAWVCNIAAQVIKHHHIGHQLPDYEVGNVHLNPSQNMGVAKSMVCRPEVMKLLLEAALLLQGTEPEAMAHYELQMLLN